MRQIRNAKSHKFTIRGGRLISKTDNNPIDRTEIEMLAQKLRNLFEWYFRFVLGQTVCIPKFGFLVLYTICEKIYKDVDDLSAWIKGLQVDFLPQEALDLNREERWKERIVRVWQKIEAKLSSGLSPQEQVREFLSEHRDLLIQKTKEHSKDVASELRKVANQLTNAKDKENFLCLSNYLILFGEVVDGRRSHPSKS